MKIPKNWFENQYFHGKSDFGVPGEECARCNHWETIGITVISACQRRRAQNWWNWRNFMKFMKLQENFGNFVDFNENHDFCVFSHPQPFTKPWYSLGNSKGWRAWHPREAAKPIILQNSRNFMKFHELLRNLMKFHKIRENSCFGVPGSY